MLDQHASEMNEGGHLVELRNEPGTEDVTEIIEQSEEGLRRRKKRCGYSYGVTVSAQVLAAYGAELALKHLICQSTSESALATHDLEALYDRIPEEVKKGIEKDYVNRLSGHSSNPTDEWKSVDASFRTAKNAFNHSRYAAEENSEVKLFPTKWLREATCSVLHAARVNIIWGSEDSRGTRLRS